VGTTDPQIERTPDGAAPSGGWGVAVLSAFAVLVLSFALLVYVPDRLLAFLTTRVSPNTRDGVVTAWVALFFIVLAWVLVALQRRGKA
jgi:hypothetical protein